MFNSSFSAVLKNTRHPLFAVFVTLLADVVIFILALWADSAMAAAADPEQLGHPAPAFTIFALLLITTVTAAVTVRALFKMAKRAVRKQR